MAAASAPPGPAPNCKNCITNVYYFCLYFRENATKIRCKIIVMCFEENAKQKYVSKKKMLRAASALIILSALYENYFIYNII